MPTDVPRVPRNWRADDAELALALWQKLTDKAQCFLMVLAKQPEDRLLAETIVAEGRLGGDWDTAHSVLSWAGRYCARDGMVPIWQTDEPRTPRSYWMSNLQAELVLRASEICEGRDSLSLIATKADTYAGPLAYVVETLARGEQKDLRRKLLRGHSVAKCALCAHQYPSPLLVAAHIKKRSQCAEVDKRKHVVAMLACLLGCDKLYEEGYLYVDDSGKIEVRQGTSGPLLERLMELRGRDCAAFNEETADYFAWHRQNVFVAV